MSVVAPFPQQRFHTIYADPPWLERGGGQIKRGADRHYELMSTKDIAALPVSSIIEPDAHLWLWVTNNFLEDGLAVMRAWGFRYVSNVAWIKSKQREDDEELYEMGLQIGLGQYIRGAHELCLFGVRGSLPYRYREDGKRAQMRSVLIAPRQEHSAKPERMAKLIEEVSHPDYIELFARQRRDGWTSWGNQV